MFSVGPGSVGDSESSLESESTVLDITKEFRFKSGEEYNTFFENSF